MQHMEMMSCNGRKRPANTGSNAPPPALAKRPKKSAEVPEDQQDASWSTVMTPELVGTVARFLDLGTPSRPDLTNLCLVVGRETSRVVRKMYLAGNEWYISYLRRLSYKTEEHRMQAGMESWLEYNPDWRNRCIGAKSEKNVHSIALEPAVAKDLSFERRYSTWVLGGSENEENFVYFEKQKYVPSGLEFGIGDALLSVGDIDVTGMERVEFRNLIASDKIIHDGKVVLKYLPVSIRLFSDPLVAAKYDFLAPFRHLIETGAVGVNDTYIADDTCAVEFKENLIWFTLGPSNIASSCKCFQYLLSAEGIDVNVEDPLSDGQLPIHFCIHSDDVFAPEALRFLVDSGKCTGLDLNAQDINGWTALHYILSFLDKSDHLTKMSKLKLLLEAGADPNVPNEDGETPEQFLSKPSNKNLSKTCSGSEVYEMVGLLRRYALRRKAESEN